MASVREAPIRAALPVVGPGRRSVVAVAAPPGRYTLGLAYAWGQPVDVRVGDFKATMPASLDRAGPAFDVGTVDVRGGKTAVAVVGRKPRGGTAERPFSGSVTFTPVGASKRVPVAQACEKYVDWYAPAASSQG